MFTFFFAHSQTYSAIPEANNQQPERTTETEQASICSWNCRSVCVRALSRGISPGLIWWCRKITLHTKGDRSFFFFFFFKNFCRTQVLFVGPLIPLFWTSGDVCPGFQSQDGFPRLRASLPVHNGFLRFTSGATPAFSTNSGVHCISVYMAWLARRLFSHASGFEPPTQWWAAQRCVTKSDVLPTNQGDRSLFLVPKWLLYPFLGQVPDPKRSPCMWISHNQVILPPPRHSRVKVVGGIHVWKLLTCGGDIKVVLWDLLFKDLTQVIRRK